MAVSLLELSTLTRDDTRTFPLNRVVARGSDLVDACSELLFDGLLEVDYVKHLLEAHGLNALESYLDNRGFAKKLNLRVGDFGEVVSASVIAEAETLVVPIKKLRYRERFDWPMRLTDGFCVQVQASKITAFVFISVKSGVTKPNDDVVTQGYDQLLEDSRVEGLKSWISSPRNSIGYRTLSS